MSNFMNDASNEMNSMLGGMFGKLAPGMCRLSMNGGIAVKTSNGYKSYNIKTGRLTACGNFAIDIGSDFFFVIPTNKVSKGDIILIKKGSQIIPKCVIDVKDKNQITVINYEDSTVETILPERHMFMGNTYFYGKIVSLLGNGIMKGKAGKNNLMKYMMMSTMFNGGQNGSQGMFGNMSGMLPLMMMSNEGFSGMFDNLFDFDSVDLEDDEDDAEESEE